MKKRSIISDNIEESQKTDFRFSMKLQKISTSTMCYHTRIELHVLTNHRLSISFGHSKQMELKEIWSCQGLNVMLFITKVCIYIQYISTNEIGWSPSWLVGWCVGKKNCANYHTFQTDYNENLYLWKLWSVDVKDILFFLDTVKATKIMCPWTNTRVVALT